MSTNGEKESEVHLQDFRGKKVVLIFYPKDNTPGCTLQACAMRDNWLEIKDLAHVFGVNADSISSHEKFIRKRNLPYPLISDPDRAIGKAYGVSYEKSMFGKTFMGTERSTFVIDEEGNLERILEKVSVIRHKTQLMEALS